MGWQSEVLTPAPSRGHVRQDGAVLGGVPPHGGRRVFVKRFFHDRWGYGKIVRCFQMCSYCKNDERSVCILNSVLLYLLHQIAYVARAGHIASINSIEKLSLT